MSLRTLRRRFGGWAAGHDWLEGISIAIGLVFFALAALCVWGVVTAIASLGDPDTAFESSQGFVQGIRGYGIVLFAILGLVAFGVAWFLSGDAIRRAGRRLRRG
jgi:hypothetical protein